MQEMQWNRQRWSTRLLFSLKECFNGIKTNPSRYSNENSLTHLVLSSSTAQLPCHIVSTMPLNKTGGYDDEALR